MPGQIAQIIKYEGDNQTFIWKHPCEDFHTGSQLIVHESQEAILTAGEQVQASISNWKLLLADAEAILETTPAGLRRDVLDMRDAIRYADPMGRPEGTTQEQEIAGGLEQLRELVRENKVAEAKFLCSPIKDTIADRASRLKILK